MPDRVAAKCDMAPAPSPSPASDSIQPQDPNSIEVAIRLRPADAKKRVDKDKAVSMEVNKEAGTITSAGHLPFRFAKIFLGEKDDIEAIASAIGSPLVAKVLQGTNATLLSYGQTGSGKSHTMLGVEASKTATAQEGVTHRMIRELFGAIEKEETRTFDVQMQNIQISHEKIFDLVPEGSVPKPPPAAAGWSALKGAAALKSALPPASPAAPKKSPGAASSASSPASASPAAAAKKSATAPRLGSALALKEDSRTSEFYVHGANLENVGSGQRAFALLKGAARMAAASSGAATSATSTSTAAKPIFICQFVITSRASAAALQDGKAEAEDPVGAHSVKRATLSFVDLCGSDETGRSGGSSSVGGKTLESIGNAPLHALGQVVEKLASGSAKAPSHESVLTRLLQESLGGNCYTAMICCATPDTSAALNTLKFAKQAQLVVNRPQVNATIDANALAAGGKLAEAFAGAQIAEQQQRLKKMAASMAQLKAAHDKELAELKGSIGSALLASRDEIASLSKSPSSVAAVDHNEARLTRRVMAAYKWKSSVDLQESLKRTTTTSGSTLKAVTHLTQRVNSARVLQRLFRKRIFRRYLSLRSTVALLHSEHEDEDQALVAAMMRANEVQEAAERANAAAIAAARNAASAPSKASKLTNAWWQRLGFMLLGVCLTTLTLGIPSSSTLDACSHCQGRADALHSARVLSLIAREVNSQLHPDR